MARRLRARLEELVITDGQLSPPSVGDTVEVHLTFVDDAWPGGAGAGCVTPCEIEPTEIRAVAEPVGVGRPREDRPGDLRWPTNLRGDGWTARWSAPRPVIGHIRARGHFAIVLAAAAAHPYTATRAAVTRIRVQRVIGPPPAHLDTDPPAATAWSDEESCPPRFPTYDNPSDPAPAIAAVLDLDIDLADAAPIRADFECGGVSAHGGDLWIGDLWRPILRRFSPAISTAVEEHLLPVGLGLYTGEVTPHASDGGIWIEQRGTLWSVDTTEAGPPRVTNLGPVQWGTAVPVGRHLVTSGGALRRFTSVGEDAPLELPPGLDHVGNLARDHDGIVVVGRSSSGDDDAPPRYRIGRHVGGEWALGEVFALPVPPTAVWPCRDGVRVLCADLVIGVDDDLQQVSEHQLPHRPVAAGPTSSGMWLSLDAQRIGLGLRDPAASDPWGLRAEIGELGPRGECHCGLVVRLDDEFTPIAVVRTELPGPSVATDADDTVWVSSRSLRGITADGWVVDARL